MKKKRERRKKDRKRCYSRPSDTHHIFISYHHANDESFKRRFEDLFAGDSSVCVSRSVQVGQISSSADDAHIAETIRSKFLRDTTVTVVLVGTETWARMHVDWEIAASLQNYRYHARSGLVGVVLPTYLKRELGARNPATVPPRLHENVSCGYGRMYTWSEDAHEVREWIRDAFVRRKRISPMTRLPLYQTNLSGIGWRYDESDRTAIGTE